ELMQVRILPGVIDVTSWPILGTVYRPEIGLQPAPGEVANPGSHFRQPSWMHGGHDRERRPAAVSGEVNERTRLGFIGVSLDKDCFGELLAGFPNRTDWPGTDQ
ncbi:MAG TPA: hypothetical protein VKE94_23430, partial [Gemmataceae bacterium]|nr:hypothetical protein [Gemmataceae bacterium]